MCGFSHVNNKYLYLMYNANGYEEFDNLLNIKIQYVMPLFEKMVINFESTNSSKDIMYFTINNTNYVGCGCKMCYSTCVKGIIF
jgi:hypothetical protein